MKNPSEQTRYMIEQIKRIRSTTGAGLVVSKTAWELCDNTDDAIDFIENHLQAIFTIKPIDIYEAYIDMLKDRIKELEK